MNIRCRLVILFLIIAIPGFVNVTELVEETALDKVAMTTLIHPDDCKQESTRRVSVGDKIILHYIGRFHHAGPHGPAGAIFETTRKKGRKPLKMTVGSPGLIAGLSKGVLGMCVGERRKLVIPPSLGYGDKGYSKMKIPSNTVLEFEVDLVGYQDEQKPRPNVFKEMDTNNDNLIQYDEMELWFQTKHPRKLPSIPRGVWEKDDANQDKVISWNEFSGPKGEEESLVRDEL